MSNGLAERMVGIQKKGLKKTVLTSGNAWDISIDTVLYRYRRKVLQVGAAPFELLYGVQPRMGSPMSVIFLPEATERQRELEMIAVASVRAGKAALEKN